MQLLRWPGEGKRERERERETETAWPGNSHCEVSEVGRRPFISVTAEDKNQSMYVSKLNSHPRRFVDV